MVWAEAAKNYGWSRQLFGPRLSSILGGAASHRGRGCQVFWIGDARTVNLHTFWCWTGQSHGGGWLAVSAIWRRPRGQVKIGGGQGAKSKSLQEQEQPLQRLECLAIRTAQSSQQGQGAVRAIQGQKEERQPWRRTGETTAQTHEGSRELNAKNVGQLVNCSKARQADAASSTTTCTEVCTDLSAAPASGNISRGLQCQVDFTVGSAVLQGPSTVEHQGQMPQDPATQYTTEKVR